MKEKNSVNWLKRKINVLTHIWKMFTGESAFGQEVLMGCRESISLPVLTLPCLGLILNQALLAGSIRAGTAPGAHPSPSAISLKKKKDSLSYDTCKCFPGCSTLGSDWLSVGRCPARRRGESPRRTSSRASRSWRLWPLSLYTMLGYCQGHQIVAPVLVKGATFPGTGSESPRSSWPGMAWNSQWEDDLEM